MSEAAAPQSIDALLERGEREDCIELSAFHELVAEAALDEADVNALYAEVESRGIELRDDWSRDESEEATYEHERLAVATTGAPPRTVASLDQPAGEGGEASLHDFLAGEGSEPLEHVEISLEQEALHRGLAKLPEQHREILRLRYGLDGDPVSLAEIGRPSRREPRANPPGRGGGA